MFISIHLGTYVLISTYKKYVYYLNRFIHRYICIWALICWHLSTYVLYLISCRGCCTAEWHQRAWNSAFASGFRLLLFNFLISFFFWSIHLSMHSPHTRSLVHSTIRTFAHWVIYSFMHFSALICFECSCSAVFFGLLHEQVAKILFAFAISLHRRVEAFALALIRRDLA